MDKELKLEKSPNKKTMTGEKEYTPRRPKKTMTDEEYEIYLDKLFAKQMREIDGWRSNDGMTLEQVGAVLGCTRERVRQIEKKALRKLRKALRERGFFEIKEILPQMEGITNPFTKD